MKLLIKKGHIIDPANKINEVLDILVKDCRIARVAKSIKEETETIIDATGKLVMPGLIDMHVHLREPGREDAETIASGTKAGLKGGFTSVLAMPNTLPAIDSVDNLRRLKAIIKRSAEMNVFIAASITKGRQGNKLVDIARLKKEGIVAISDDGSSVDSARIMREAFKKAKQEKVLVICHCEDKSLSAQGVVNLGFISTRLGLRGISNESEYRRVQRDIELAKEARCLVHIAHISCRESVELIANAKRKKIKVTAETAPHYFCLSEEEVAGYDTNMKVNPPLRSKEDVSSLRQGLRDGTIDVIATDHAPHTEAEKNVEFDKAPFGTIGLETALSLGITELVNKKILTWMELVEKMSLNPARILNLDRGRLSVGDIADIIIVQPDREWIVKKEEIWSGSKNSAFLGKRLKGMVLYTICGGKIVYQAMNQDEICSYKRTRQVS